MKLISFLILLSVLSGCKTQPKTIRSIGDLASLTYLESGASGGFTGEQEAFILLSDGRRYAFTSFDENLKDLGKISKKEAAGAFSEAEKIQWSQLPDPSFGNMTYYLKYHLRDTSFEHSWGRYGDEPPAALQSLQESMNKLMPSK